MMYLYKIAAHGVSWAAQVLIANWFCEFVTAALPGAMFLCTYCTYYSGVCIKYSVPCSYVYTIRITPAYVSNIQSILCFRCDVPIVGSSFERQLFTRFCFEAFHVVASFAPTVCVRARVSVFLLHVTIGWNTRLLVSGLAWRVVRLRTQQPLTGSTRAAGSRQFWRHFRRHNRYQAHSILAWQSKPAQNIFFPARRTLHRTHGHWNGDIT